MKQAHSEIKINPSSYDMSHYPSFKVSKILFKDQLEYFRRQIDKGCLSVLDMTNELLAFLYFNFFTAYLRNILCQGNPFDVLLLNIRNYFDEFQS